MVLNLSTEIWPIPAVLKFFRNTPLNAVIKVSIFFTAFFPFPKADLKSKIDFEKKV